MAATTEPRRKPTGAPSGGAHRKRSYSWLYIGGIIFVAAWAIWSLILVPLLYP